MRPGALVPVVHRGGVAVKTSEVGLAIIRAFEGCLKPIPGRPGFFKPYICPAGVLTIGWGSTNHHEPKFTKDSVWSQQQCNDALKNVVATFERHVEKHAKVPLAQHEFDALVSWAYNTGGPAHASLWKALNAGNKAAIPGKLMAWNKAGGKVLNGLTRRREAEAKLFVGNVNGALATAGVAKMKPLPMPQQVDPPKTATARKTGTGAIVIGGGAAANEAKKAWGPGAAVAIIAVAIVIAVLAWRFWPKKEG
jgi:lysozyme